MTAETIDPVTFEIALHRLWQVTEEMGIALTRTSGSVVTIESRDYMTALYDAAGNCVMSGCGVITHTWAFANAARYLLKEKGEDPGIHEGDSFIMNDPYIASIHQGDMATFSPIHYRGELVGWAATMTHLVDIGAIDPGGTSPSAREVFQEGIRLRGAKLVDRGKLNSDIFGILLNNVRDPGMVGLDMKAQLAAAETCRRRVIELIENIGLETYRRLCSQAIKYAEDKFRTRLQELPEGSWSATVYQDGDVVSDRIYRVCLTLTKKGDKLTFDFSGSSEQTPCCVNATLQGTRGGVFGAVAPLLAYDIPWNQGILNLLEVIAPAGSILNCTFPAPCSMSSTGGTFLAANASIMAISRMLSCTEKYKDEATAQWSSSSPGLTLSGLGKDGRRFVSLIMEGLCGGGGANRNFDGVDVAGKPWTPENQHPDVESLELRLPVLYLYRRMVADSGGAGKFRGGMAGEFCLKLYEVPDGKLSVSVATMGVEPLNGHGLCGGYPSHNVKIKVRRGANVGALLASGRLLGHFDEARGKLEVLASKQVTELADKDIISLEWNGGGGYGDPLEREPSLVEQDVRDGLVSLQCAQELYGVVIDPKGRKADLAATEEMRKRIRQARLSAGLCGRRVKRYRRRTK